MKITKQIRKQVHDKYFGGCAYCGQYVPLKDMQVDHMTPKCHISEKKNNFEQIHSIDNLMPSCRSCNHYKRAYDLEQFRHAMITLHKRISQIYICKVAERYGIITIKPFDGRFYFEIPEHVRCLPF